jgi:hypothetical protein
VNLSLEDDWLNGNSEPERSTDRRVPHRVSLRIQGRLLWAREHNTRFFPSLRIGPRRPNSEPKLIAGHVILDVKKTVEIAKVGITFTGSTKSAKRQTQLFSIQDVVWDAAPPKGKAPAKNNHYSDVASPTSPRRIGTANVVGRIFLFAIKWPLVNYPPSIPPRRSVVETDYVLRAFMNVKGSDEQYLSEPLIVDFRPRIYPSLTPLSIVDESKSSAVLKDDHGKVLGEAKLECTDNRAAVFGSDYPFTLTILSRQSDAKYLPHKAKIDICEIHKSIDTKQVQTFILSHETFPFPPELLEPHHECPVPIRVHIPIPELDSWRGALGLPTLSIGDLIVEYRLHVTIPVSQSRFKLNNSAKTLVVECPFFVGNAKPKDSESKRKIPRLVVNAEGEGNWDSPSTSPRDVSRLRTEIISDWAEGCAGPRFLAGGDVEEDNEIVM